METIRAFIAIEIPPEIRQKLDEIESVLKSASRAPVKWVEPDSIHLTLKFLGDTDVNKVDTIIEALGSVLPSIPAPRLEVKGLGVFPSPHRTQVVWAGLGGDMKGLTAQQQAVEDVMEPFGFRREKRRFSPHLTLGRVRDRATQSERQELGSLATGTSFDGGSFNGSPIHLIKSVLTRQGPIYTQLASFASC